MKPVFPILILLVAITSIAWMPASAGVAKTLDGKTIEGVVSIDPDGGLNVLPQVGPMVHLDFGDLFDAVLSDKPGDMALRRGVILTDGSQMAADENIVADDLNISVPNGSSAQSIPLRKISRIIFRPIPSKLLATLQTSGHGALLDTGDFVDGDFKGIIKGKARIASVLFGNCDYDPAGQVLAINVGDVSPVASDWVVKQIDGTLILAQSIQTDGGNLVLKDIDDRIHSIEPAAVGEIRCGSNRMISLTDLTPVKLDDAGLGQHGFAKDATTVDVPMALVGFTPAHGIGMAAGAAATYQLDGKFRAFAARAGMPVGIMPTCKVQFVVEADGKEVFRSNDLTSVDDPAEIAIDVAGVKQITLRVESRQPADLGAAGLWGDPALIKQGGKQLR